MATQTWLGRFAIGSATDTIDLAGGGSSPTVSLTSGRYFVAGYTSEATDQLCEHITTQVRAEGGDYADFSMTFSYTTGKVSVVCGAGDAVNVTWTDTDLRDLLGFTGNITNLDDTAQTASNEAKYVWRPDRSFSEVPVDNSRVVAPRSSTMLHVSRDGTVTTVKGNTTYAGTLEYVMLDDARVIVPSSGSVNQEFETFFEDVVAEGERIRLFPDDTATTSSDYVTVVIGVPGESVGSFEDFAVKHISSYNGLWDMQIPVVKYP